MIYIAIPNKGRLHEPTLSMFKDAGLPVQGAGNGSRQLIAKTSDPDITFILARAADIPLFVAEGTADIGVTGLDLIAERGADLDVMTELDYGKASLVLAVPNASPIRELKDLEGKRVATEFPAVTRRFFEENRINVDVIEVSGACEMTPHIGVADAIVDITSSGTTLLINQLRQVAPVFDSRVCLVANRKSISDPEKKKIRDVRMAIESVLCAKKKRYIMMNVPGESLEEVEKIIPGLAGPTIMEVQSDRKMYAVHVVVDADEIFTLVGKLRKAGANGILVLPIERLIP